MTRYNASNEKPYHILVRKGFFVIGFVDKRLGKNGRPSYSSMRSTTIKASADKQSSAYRSGREKVIKIAEALLNDGKAVKNRNSVVDYLLNFWDYEKSDYILTLQADGKSISETYCNSNIALIRNYFLPYAEAQGIKTFDDLTKKALLDWKNYLYKELVKTGKLSGTTVNKARQAVFVAIRQAALFDLIASDPTAGIKPVKETPKPREIFLLPELNELFKTPWNNNDPVPYACCLLAATSGMRLGEIRGLLIKNVHLESQYLDVLTSFQDKEGLKPPKCNSFRSGVPIPEHTVDAMQEALTVHPSPNNPEAYFFSSPSNPLIPVGSRRITNAYELAMKNAGIQKGKCFHSLRHTYISYLRGVIPDSQLIQMVGHSNIETTNGYTHQTQEGLDNVRNAVSRMISAPLADSENG